MEMSTSSERVSAVAFKVLVNAAMRSRDWSSVEALILSSQEARANGIDSVYALAFAQSQLGKGLDGSVSFAEGLEPNPLNDEASQELRAYNAENVTSRRILLEFVRKNLGEIKKVAGVLRQQAKPTGPHLFSYWGQGLQEAPKVVTALHEHNKSHHKSGDVVFLDDKTVTEWLEVPEYAPDASVGLAMRSDLIRVMLLARYGGVWADSTCYLTTNVLEEFKRYIEGGGFFAYRLSPRNISNWFLASAAGGYQITMIAAALMVYWRSFDRPLVYFMFHEIFEALIVSDNEFALENMRWPFVKRQPSLKLARRINEPFDEAIHGPILRSTAVHKLTRKKRKARGLEFPPNSVRAYLVGY